MCFKFITSGYKGCPKGDSCNVSMHILKFAAHAYHTIGVTVRHNLKKNIIIKNEGLVRNFSKPIVCSYSECRGRLYIVPHVHIARLRSLVYNSFRW